MKFVICDETVYRGAQTAALVGVAVAVVMIVSIYIDHRNWENFKRTHNCKAVIQVISTDNGAQIVDEPTQEMWVCNDGKTYIKGGWTNVQINVG